MVRGFVRVLVPVVFVTFVSAAAVVTASGCRRQAMALSQPAPSQPAAAESRNMTGTGGSRAGGALAGTAGAAGKPNVLQVVATGASAGGAAADPPATSSVLAEIHQADMKEIDMGELAEKRGTSKEVKNYGAMLVKDHRMADKKVVELAKHENIQLPSITDQEKTKATHMAPSAGADFDVTFAKDMVTDHQRTIAELKKVQSDTSDVKLKSLLNDLLPTLEKHEKAAQAIVDREKK